MPETARRLDQRLGKMTVDGVQVISSGMRVLYACLRARSWKSLITYLLSLGRKKARLVGRLIMSLSHLFWRCMLIYCRVYVDMETELDEKITNKNHCIKLSKYLGRESRSFQWYAVFREVACVGSMYCWCYCACWRHKYKLIHSELFLWKWYGTMWKMDVWSHSREFSPIQICGEGI